MCAMLSGIESQTATRTAPRIPGQECEHHKHESNCSKWAARIRHLMWKSLASIEPLWQLAHTTSRDAPNACYKGPRPSCDHHWCENSGRKSAFRSIIFGQKRSHHVMDSICWAKAPSDLSLQTKFLGMFWCSWCNPVTSKFREKAWVEQQQSPIGFLSLQIKFLGILWCSSCNPITFKILPNFIL